MESFRIPLEKEFIRFRDHLNHNQRIIFSAKFGDGKTTFLKSFQDDERQSDCYFLTIHPVNYSVARNEDIFEFIKRDILFQLHRDGYLENIDLDVIFKDILSWNFFRPVISYILSFVPGGAFYEKLIEKAKAFKDKYEEQKSTWEKLEVKFQNKIGSIYEEDCYTQIIKDAVKYIQTRVGNEKKVVLIIEDLDRIDPAHLFRILNILGAHIDIDLERNKFGVDNIIAVLDYNVTAQIFKHFYGEHANYDGYMSKFYSRYIYNFSITQIAQEYLKDFLRTYIPEEAFSAVLYESLGCRPTVDSKISQLSIRRIVQIMSGFEESISRYSIHVNFVGDVIPDAPILYLVAFLVRLNDRFERRDIISSLQNGNLIIDMLGSFLLTNSEIAKMRPFRVYTTFLYPVVRSKAPFFVTEYKRVQSSSNFDIPQTVVDDAFRLACSMVVDCPKV